jgi:putative drug exporter of the RND superfamily
MTPVLYRIGKLCARFPWPIIAVWLVIAVVIALIAKAAGQDTTDNLTLPGTNSQKATDLLSDKFPQQANGQVPVSIVAPAGKTVKSYSQVIDQVTSSYAHDPDIGTAVSPLAKQAQGQISRNGRFAFIALYPSASPTQLSVDDANRIVALEQPLKNAGLKAAVGGYIGQKVSKPSTGLSVIVGLIAAVIILLFTFGSAVAMGIPIITALIGLATGLSIVTLLGHVAEVPTTAPALATMIGLGVGIDYALFMVSRHRAQLAAGMDVHESVARATATAGGAVVFAGSTVIIALLCLFAAGIPLVSTLGYTAAIVVLVAMAAAITLLPSILRLLGTRINRLRLPGLSTHHDERPHGWARWARFVADHPWPMLLGGLAFLILLAIPVLSLTLGQPDNSQLPTDTQTRQSYDQMEQGFGVGSNGTALIAVSLQKPATQGDQRLSQLRDAIAKTPGVEAVSEPQVNKAGTAAVMNATPTTAPASEATTDLVKNLRDNVIPAATKGKQMSADVGGTTAGYIDLASEISKKLPLVIALVLIFSFILLMLAFRSVLVPLKAVVMNVFSILAAFGIVTYVFQHHWSATLIGLDHTIPVVSYVPLMMFAILFGLSMDYEVFLMTHVRERWKISSDPHDAVIHGLATTARVITSAALIMVSVFCAFVINGNPTIKQFGLGMAAAVAVDATVVRCLLVPAIMSLLGRAGWWMPPWLDSHLPQLSIEGDEYFASQESSAHGGEVPQRA